MPKKFPAIAGALMTSASCHGDSYAGGDTASIGSSSSSSAAATTSTETGTTDAGSLTTGQEASATESDGPTSGSGTSFGLADPACPPLVLDGNMEIHSTKDTIDLPLYTHIKGDVSVAGVSGLDTLDALGCIHTIDGQLAIFSNPDLETLAGLERLWSVGSLWVKENDMLMSLEGLGVHHLSDPDGYNQISRNPNLEVIALRELETVANLYIGGCTGVSPRTPGYALGNPGLREIDGLNSLRAFDLLVLLGNESLDSLEGMVGLAERTGPPETDGPALEVSIWLNASLSAEYVQEFWNEHMFDGPELAYTCGNLNELEQVCPCWSGG